MLAAGVPSQQQGPLVYVEQGALRGTYLTSASGRIFAAFQGIPYARPPTGKHRFKVFPKENFSFKPLIIKWCLFNMNLITI